MPIHDPALTLAQLTAAMRSRGVRQLYAKKLSANDNSKNQIYLGGDFRVINVLPAGTPQPATSGKHRTPIFKAPLRLEWMGASGESFPAPNAQLILYPQYPEVRLSGFLLGAAQAPNDVLTVRELGRILFLGVTADRRIVGYATPADSVLANEIRATPSFEEEGVLLRIPLVHAAFPLDSRRSLLEVLCRISRQGWITGWKLGPNGERLPCTARNCVGVTLESELGIRANGRAEPDFDGWEVKAHTVTSLSREGTGAITLMTPEPNGGIYSDVDTSEFVQRFGYADKLGRIDRWNFGGIHRVGVRCASTGLTLMLDGYDAASGRITRADGAVALTTDSGEVAASWSFSGLLVHWARKHARAVFVPAVKRSSPQADFLYGNSVLLAEGTDYGLVLRGLAEGTIYYDPGIKVEDVSTAPKVKKRSQFRVARRSLGTLYHATSEVDCCVEV